MAALDTTRISGAGQSFGGRAMKAFTSAFAALASWNDSRVTRKELSRLSNRELEDIGLSRGDIAQF